MYKPMIQCITNRVTAYQVARVIRIAEARPIMSEAIEEFEEIIPDCEGILLNMGTPNQERFLQAHTCCQLANQKDIPILLDSVGCGQTQFRLDNNLDLLKKYKIQVLKVNLGEAISLLEEKTNQDGIGVDGSQYMLRKTEKDSLQVGKALYKKFTCNNPEFVLVITGKKDIVISNSGINIIESERSYLSDTVGTGCMLGGLMIAEIARLNRTTNKSHQTIIKGVKCGAHRMKKAGELATKQMRGNYKEGSFLIELLDALSLQRPKLYLITDESLDFYQDLLPRTRWALEAGIDYLQYRAKNKKWFIMEEEIKALQVLCHQYDTPLIINDYIQLAKDLNADGVHLGILDDAIDNAIHILGESAIIGATAKTLEQAKRAYNQGASYLGVGALFPSVTKQDAISIEHELLIKMKQEVPLPMYGIGGIKKERITKKLMRSLNGLAMVNAIYQLNTKEEIFQNINEIKKRMLLKYEIESEDKYDNIYDTNECC